MEFLIRTAREKALSRRVSLCRLCKRGHETIHHRAAMQRMWVRTAYSENRVAMWHTYERTMKVRFQSWWWANQIWWWLTRSKRQQLRLICQYQLTVMSGWRSMRKYERCHCLKGQVERIWKVKMKVVPVLMGTLRPVTSKPGSSMLRLQLSLSPLLELDRHPRSLVEVLSLRKTQTINTDKLQY